ncbi:MAG: protein arginine kinase [Puniceicoccaceae bacterium]|nr:MAG: protein arginine kinase [Puniceicoccaceae bacterium]
MIESIIKSDNAELTQSTKKGSPVVLSTRVRLARNLVGTPFPERASSAQRSDIMTTCADQITNLPQLKQGAFFDMSELSDLEKQVLVERHLISRELCEAKAGSAVFINKDQTCSVMINEEDHLRIQFLKTGFSLRSVWKQIDRFDTSLEGSLDIAFSREFGYLTACPTNLGTALRASVMMHLPGLVISDHMEKVIRAVNQLGITVRGLFGEGSDATGHVFQISNQQTLGESEEQIMSRLRSVFKSIIDHEINARFKYLEENRARLLDQIGRAFGVLQNAHVLNSNEALNLLSLMRLAVDFGMLPEDNRCDVDRLFIECQPGHIQHAAGEGIEPSARDLCRADKLRREFAQLPALDFDKVGNLA